MRRCSQDLGAELTTASVRSLRNEQKLTEAGDIVATAGSLENVSRLVADRNRCVEQFAFVQDGTPIPSDSGLELLGRLPEPESFLLLGRNRSPCAALPLE